MNDSSRGYHDNMYKYLVSSKKEGSIRRRMYVKDGVMLECEKEIVNLIKDPDALETDVWDCTFRYNGQEVKKPLRFDDMCLRFFNLSIKHKKKD
jgi:hypothetical protein